MTIRHTVDSITSDALDQLYAETDRLTAELGDYDQRAEQQQKRAARAEAALREVLDLFTPATTLRADGTALTYSTTDVIDAARMTRWRATLGEQPATKPCDAVHPTAPSAQCIKLPGHTGEHAGMTNYWLDVTWPNLATTDGDCCGAEPPPADWVGDCWCTLPPSHEGEHRCQPCTDRHGAPGWTDPKEPS